MNPHLRPRGMITLVNRHSTNIYSGMFPGLISGKYKFEEIVIDLRKLSMRAGVSFIKAEIKRVDPLKKNLILDERTSIDFSHISIDVGSETLLNQETLQLIENFGCSIKPFKKS